MNIELRIPVIEELNENIKILIGMLCRNPEEPADFDDEFKLLHALNNDPIKATLSVGVTGVAPKTPDTPTAPTAPTAPTIPTTQAAPTAPPTVETAEVAYTLDQLQKCVAELVRGGGRDALASVIHGMGLNTMMELKPEQYNDFAAKLRTIGGVL